MSLHIGKLIDRQLKAIGMSKSVFARRIVISPQNIHYILKKKSIDTDLLRKVSLALNYDFFQHYLGLNQYGKNNEQLFDLTSHELKRELEDIKKEIAILTAHNNYIREIVSLMQAWEKKTNPAKTNTAKTITRRKSTSSTKMNNNTSNKSPLKPQTKNKSKKTPVRKNA